MQFCIHLCTHDLEILLQNGILLPIKVFTFDHIHRCTDDFNGAQLKAVCVEAGMIALRRKAEELAHEDYMDGESTCVGLVGEQCMCGSSGRNYTASVSEWCMCGSGGEGNIQLVL